MLAARAALRPLSIRISLARTSARTSARAFSSSPRAFEQFQGPIRLKDTVYTANAIASDAGWDGTVRSVGTDNPLELNMATPKAMGGTEIGNNPDELLAMGYACALQFVAAREGKKEAAENAKVHVKVILGSPESLEGYGFALELAVEGCKDSALIAAAHEFCPYSRMIKYGAQTKITTI